MAESPKGPGIEMLEIVERRNPAREPRCNAAIAAYSALRCQFSPYSSIESVNVQSGITYVIGRRVATSVGWPSGMSWHAGWTGGPPEWRWGGDILSYGGRFYRHRSSRCDGHRKACRNAVAAACAAPSPVAVWSGRRARAQLVASVLAGATITMLLWSVD
jgi:hypothetical protein